MRGERGLAPADAQDRLTKPSYDLKSLPRQAAFLHELASALTECGLQVFQIDHEDAQGQYELNFLHDDALASADHLMLFKLAAHALAERHGMVFSMMPKPFANQPGSGMHFHVSLWEGGRCLFDDDSTLRHFIGGVLAHSAGLAALAATTVNSYKRLVVGKSLSGTSWAPAHVAQGPNNRTAALRTLHGRFEWRVPDATANPYLATAALIAAGLDGIERKLEPPPDCNDDLFELSAPQLRARGIGLLPQSLGEALDALGADDLICNALGETATQQFVQLKRDEFADYRRHISDWEWRRYAEAF